MKELARRIRLNGHTVVFRPQTLKWKPPYRVSFTKSAEQALFVRVFRANEARSGRRARDTRDGRRCGKFFSVPSLSCVWRSSLASRVPSLAWRTRKKLTPPCSTGWVHCESNPNPDLSFDRPRVLGQVKTNSTSWFSLENGKNVSWFQGPVFNFYITFVICSCCSSKNVEKRYQPGRHGKTYQAG